MSFQLHLHDVIEEFILQPTTQRQSRCFSFNIGELTWHLLFFMKYKSHHNTSHFKQLQCWMHCLPWKPLTTRAVSGSRVSEDCSKTINRTQDYPSATSAHHHSCTRWQRWRKEPSGITECQRARVCVKAEDQDICSRCVFCFILCSPALAKTTQCVLWMWPICPPLVWEILRSTPWVALNSKKCNDLEDVQTNRWNCLNPLQQTG